MQALRSRHGKRVQCRQPDDERYGLRKQHYEAIDLSKFNINTAAELGAVTGIMVFRILKKRMINQRFPGKVEYSYDGANNLQ